jgi:hypothetical protein
MAPMGIRQSPEGGTSSAVITRRIEAVSYRLSVVG